MSRVRIDLHALNENLNQIGTWMREFGASWTVVTKVLCGHRETIQALQRLGVQSMADSRLRNLRMIEDTVPGVEFWYLRPPHLSIVEDVVALSHVSLNSEIRVIEGLNQAARKRDKIHRIVIMIELGDLREGILPGSLVEFYQKVFQLSNIEVIGIGANLGCLAGSVPTVDQFMQIILYQQLLELKFQAKLPVLSAGSSSVLPLLLNGELPKAINHFRIGESIFLGTDLINGGVLPGLRDDVVVLETEIAEIKEKGLVPLGETGTSTPFEGISEEEYSPGQRGHRALVPIGQLDTEVSGLKPLDERYKIAGASSDITVINLGDNPENLEVGDPLRFKLDYSALLRLMSSQYVPKAVTPSLDEFSRSASGSEETSVDRVVEEGPSARAQGTAS
ncbi:MAG: alanine/ornithine racemase family PLP-dependent enzyme [Candidatus Eisenbacteria bacterium]|nr:alanine/ornithine racemase family PLP-dependent enzyme [Candidatus Latescibacterota bacterium]MBD3301125.1 alanine/ornithine racemase family PLP-dependent enzyme [Candidatus Eisenbacteria bacterium]